MRETYEEIGVPADRVRLIGPGDRLYGYANFTLFTYLGVVDYEDYKKAKLAEDEVSEIFLMPLKTIEETKPEIYVEKITTNIDKGFPYERLGISEDYGWRVGTWEIPVYDFGNRVIWGMKVDHSEYLEVLRAVRELPGIKKVFIRSGIRYDYVMADKDDTFLRELCQYHVSGTLKVAPEHISDQVLAYMRKPKKQVFIDFADKYKKINEELGLKQYLIPYLISSHPGCTLNDAIELALFLKDYGFIPDQVQDFYPTPGTLATCMYYTEKDPFTMKPIYVAKSLNDKKMQRALIHYNKPENRRTVIEALELAGRPELIGVLLKGKGGRYESDKRIRKDNEGQQKAVHSGKAGGNAADRGDRKHGRSRNSGKPGGNARVFRGDTRDRRHS